jgi:WD40 repeat protein
VKNRFGMTDSRLIKGSAIPSAQPVQDFAVAEVKGRPLVVCADFDNEVWTWDLLADTWEKRPLAGFDDGVYPYPLYPDFQHLAVEVVHGQVLFAAGGEHQGPALWDLMSGDLLSAPPLDRSCVHAMALARAAERTLLVAGASSPEVYLWDPSAPEGSAWGPPDDEFAELPGHGDDMCGLVVGRLDGRPVVVSGGDDTVVAADLERGETVHEWSVDGIVSAVALSEVGGRPAVLAGTDAGYVRTWDAVDGKPAGNPLSGHEDRVSAVAVTAVEGRRLAVTGSDDGTARIWDLAEGRQLGPPLAGHDGEIGTVTVTSVGGRQVVLTAGRDGVVRVWDLANVNV